MADSLDTQRNTIVSAPKTPGDTLLKNFKEKLEVRWSEFDAATMKEAQAQVENHPLGGLTNAKKERDKDANFIKAKAAFDQARIALNAVTDDIGLKQILNSPGNLLSAIQTLEAHFAVVTAPEKAKEYNHVLANTLADLTSLKSQVTDTAEDKKAAEIAAATVKAMPAVAVVAAGTTAMATGAMSNITGGLTDEISTELKKELGPWGMIFKGVKGVPPKEVASQIKDLTKEYSEKKWMDDPFDKLFAGIKLFFLKWQISRAGMDLSKDMTPEEMKLAGLGGKVEVGKPVEKSAEKTKNNDNLKYVASVDMLLKFGQNKEERSENVLGTAGQLLKEPKFNQLNIATLKKGYNLSTKKFDINLLGEADKGIINTIAIDNGQKIKALNLIARLFLDTSNSIQSNISASLLKGGDTLSLRTSILSASQNLRKFTPFGSIDISNPQAMIQEGSGKYIPTVDTQSKELTGELADDFNSSMGKKNALWLFGYAATQQVPLDIKGIDAHFQSENPDLSKDPEDQKKLRNILAFGVDLRATIAKDTTINFGEGQAVSRAIEKVFTLSDLGILYTFLDGKSDISTMNSLEKGFLIMKIADMVGVNDKALFGKYSTAIMNSLLGLDSPIDPSVKKVFGDMLGYATDKAGDAISDTVQVIWGSANKNPVVALGLVVTMLFGPWFSKRTALVGPMKK